MSASRYFVLKEIFMITGSIPALVTPFQPDGRIDFAALEALINWHVEQGSDALVIAGTTGESATIDMTEHCQVIEAAVRFSNKRIPIIAGTGANSTSEAIELTHFAQKAGANAGLSVVPYYNKPTQEGQYQHFRAIAEASPLPLILYNVPGRTVADMSNDTVLRLAQIPNVVGIKDATGDIGRGSDLIARAPADFAVYSGDDPSAFALMLLGGKGSISVTANVVPRLMHQFCKAAMAGDAATTRTLQNQLITLHRAIFLEANPIPVKWVLAEMGKMGHLLRLPLTPLSDGSKPALRAALAKAGVNLQ